MAELLQVTPLPNGWLLEEYQWEQPVYFAGDGLSGNLGRFYCSVMRVPSTRKVRSGHYAGASAAERAAAVRVGRVASTADWRSGWLSTVWKQFEFLESDGSYWRAIIGDPIDVADAFDAITQGLEDVGVDWSVSAPAAPSVDALVLTGGAQ